MMNSTNSSGNTYQEVNHIIFQVNCIVYIPLFIAGLLIHGLGIAFHLINPEASGGSTVRIWAIAISSMEIVDLLYGGIYRTLTYAKYVPYIPVKPYLFLQYFIGGLTPIYTLGFTAEKMVAVTWPLHCRNWISPRYAFLGIITTSVYLAMFCIINTVFSFDWTPKMNKTKAFIYFYWFETLVNIILVAVLHLIASLFIMRAVINSSFKRRRLTTSVPLKTVKTNDAGPTYHSVNPGTTESHDQEETSILSLKEFRICVIILFMNVAYFVFVLPYWTMWIPRNMGYFKGRVAEILNFLVRPMPWMCRFFDALFLYVADVKFKLWISHCLKLS